jgi:hypothetical protein
MAADLLQTNLGDIERLKGKAKESAMKQITVVRLSIFFPRSMSTLCLEIERS